MVLLFVKSSMVSLRKINETQHPTFIYIYICIKYKI